MTSAFPFTSIPHKQYRNTFLQSVLLQYNFEQISNPNIISDFRTRLENYISTTFSLKLQEDTDTSFWDQGISISRKDSISWWAFRNGCVIVNIGVKDYVSFVDSILPQAFKMRTFLSKVLGIDKVVELHVRKINVWQFHADNAKDFDADKIRKSVFSDCLLKEKTNCDLNDEEKHIQNFKKIRFGSDSNEVLIRHLYYKTSNAFLLYLDTESILREDILINDIENKLIDLNETLFNAFHWSVNKTIIEIMEGTGNE